MRESLKIHIIGVAPSEGVEAKIRQRAGRLARCTGDVQYCQVWLAPSRGQRRKGALYGARIILTVPDEVIVVDLQPTEEDPNVAIREAFAAARRRLRVRERRRRGRVRARTGSAQKPSGRRTPASPEGDGAGLAAS